MLENCLKIEGNSLKLIISSSGAALKGSGVVARVLELYWQEEAICKAGWRSKVIYGIRLGFGSRFTRAQVEKKMTHIWELSWHETVILTDAMLTYARTPNNWQYPFGRWITPFLFKKKTYILNFFGTTNTLTPYLSFPFWIKHHLLKNLPQQYINLWRTPRTR